MEDGTMRVFFRIVGIRFPKISPDMERFTPY
jgi:hypothetical protein